MDTLTGRGACPGIVFGTIRYLRFGPPKIERRTVDDPEQEALRFHRAKDEAVRELRDLAEKALRELGEASAQLFEAHQLMLEDDDFIESVTDLIRSDKCNAEHAVAGARDDFVKMFSQMSSAYMRERAADIRDVSSRVIRILSGAASAADLTEPCIVAAAELSPSETVQLDKAKILGFVTAGGSTNSHTAILARTMGIPAVVAAGDGLNPAVDGRKAILDGGTGTLILSPDAETEEAYRHLLAGQEERKKLLESLRGKKNLTKDGREILVYANIGNPADLPSVIENDAGGIGLFRTEFLYLESADCPTEEAQLAIYRRVLEGMGRKRVIFRTLDIGADKQAPYLNLAHEENPAMGLRAIRLCFARPDLLKTQLRALYRASVYGKEAIMFPMIASVWEIQKIKEIIHAVQTELMNEDLAFRPDVELGIMVETPAAAILSDEFAKEVDFFSLGTNDLTQYTLAADRQNAALEPYFSPKHEAVLRLVERTIQNAHAHGIWCGICGEAAGDPALTERFIQMGVDELSVSPPKVLPLRDAIRGIDSGL